MGKILRLISFWHFYQPTYDEISRQLYNIAGNQNENQRFMCLFIFILIVSTMVGPSDRLACKFTNFRNISIDVVFNYTSDAHDNLFKFSTLGMALQIK